MSRWPWSDEGEEVEEDVLEEEGRIAGLEEPSFWRRERMEGAERGSTSMGMVGQDVKRRGWSLRWSKKKPAKLKRV